MNVPLSPSSRGLSRRRHKAQRRDLWAGARLIRSVAAEVQRVIDGVRDVVRKGCAASLSPRLSPGSPRTTRPQPKGEGSWRAALAAA